MLRRQLPLAEPPQRWLLLSQVEHARLSFDLARHWGNEAVPPVVDVAQAGEQVRAEWLRGVYHHDDGWGASEADPPIDPEEGRPFSFLDLPRDQSLAIWRDSIHLARREGPLAGWCVARHFIALLESSDDAQMPIAQDWVAELRQVSDGWFDQWQSLSSVHETETAERCHHGLQWFDWLSLWLCLECPATGDDPPTEPHRAETTWGEVRAIELIPAENQSRGEPRRVVVKPWPFAVPELRLQVLGYAIPARRYTDYDELVERRVPQSLAWHLVS